MTTATLPRDELPVWMRRAMRGTDWGVLLVLSLCLLASIPFVTYSTVPIGTAFERYAFKTSDIAQSLREGRLYPRWTDEAIGGYGAPIPHFTPPASGYIPAVLDVTLINDPALSVTLTFAAALCFAGTATYAFVTRLKGATTGLTVAVLYIFSPFIGYTIPQQLGDLSLALGAAFLPALLWSIDRVLSYRSTSDVIYVALSYAALWLTEPRFALAGSVLAFILIFTHYRSRGAIVWQPILGGLLGAGLAACYWLPALLEASQVVWYPSETSPLHLVSLQTLFALPVIPDPAAMINPPSLSLGIILPACALLALIMLLRGHQMSSLYFFGMGAAGGGFITFALANPNQVWLLAPSALCLSVASSAALDIRKLVPAQFRRLIPAAILALAIGSVLPLWLTDRSSPEAQAVSDFSSSSQVTFEQRGFGVAVIPPGELVPSTIPLNLPQDDRLMRGYLTGTPRRFAQTGSAQIGILNDNAHDLHLQVQAFSDTSLRILSASFPGWTAHLSGRTIPFSIENATNGTLPRLNLTQGERGELIVSLEPTLARLAGWAITWMALGSMLLIRFLRGRQSTSMRQPEQVELLTPAETRLFAVLFAGVGLLIGFRFASPQWADLAGWQPMPGIGLSHAQTYNVRSDAGLELIGYSMPDTESRAGGFIDLTLYWRSLRQLDENYRIQLALRDRSTRRVDTVTPIQYPGALPTLRWSPRRYVQDSWQIAVPSTLSAGDYDLLVSVFTCTLACQTRELVSFFDEFGVPLGEVFTLPIPVRIISQ